MSELRCFTCTRPVSSPYRRHDASGRIVEGCIDASHDGNIFGESLRWHMRPIAKEIRKKTKDRIRELLKREKRGT